jgi:hypothetical protein
VGRVERTSHSRRKRSIHPLAWCSLRGRGAQADNSTTSMHLYPLSMLTFSIPLADRGLGGYVTALPHGPNRLREEALTARGRRMLSFSGRSRGSCRASSVCRIGSSYYFVSPRLVSSQSGLVSLGFISLSCDCYSIISTSLPCQINPDRTE